MFLQSDYTNCMMHIILFKILILIQVVPTYSDSIFK